MTFKMYFKTYFALIFTFLYFFMSLWGNLHHEPWMDELQAWQIAHISHNLVEFYHNFNSEGHPPLWHFLLYVITRFTENVWYMQLLHTCIATVCSYLILAYAPFHKWQRAAFCFGYYQLFEFGMISRCYALGFLWAALFCVLYLDSSKKLVRLAIVLGLMMNTSMYGAIMAVGLFSLLLYDFVKAQRERIPYQYSCMTVVKVLTILAGFAFCALFFMFRWEGDAKFTMQDDVDAYSKCVQLAENITNAFFTLPDFSRMDFWETNGLAVWDQNMEFTLMTFMCMGLFGLYFLKKPKVALFYIGTTSLMIFFMLYFHLGFIRHHGHLFLVLVLAFWMMPHQYTMLGKSVEYVFSILLAVQLLGGTIAWYKDLKYPFSTYGHVASFLRSQKQPYLLIGSKTTLSPMVAYIPRQEIFILEHQAFEKKMHPQTEGDKMISARLLSAAVCKVTKPHPNIYFMMYHGEIPEDSLLKMGFEMELRDSVALMTYVKDIEVYRKKD